MLSTFEAENTGLSDQRQLEFAIHEERTILTHNIGDFERLYKKYLSEKRDHFGIIVSPQDGIGEVLRRLLKLLDQLDAEQIKNSFHHLAEFK